MWTVTEIHCSEFPLQFTCMIYFIWYYHEKWFVCYRVPVLSDHEQQKSQVRPSANRPTGTIDLSTHTEQSSQTIRTNQDRGSASLWDQPGPITTEDLPAHRALAVKSDQPGPIRTNQDSGSVYTEQSGPTRTEPVPVSQSVGTIEKAGGQRAGSPFLSQTPLIAHPFFQLSHWPRAWNRLTRTTDLNVNPYTYYNQVRPSANASQDNGSSCPYCAVKFDSQPSQVQCLYENSTSQL